MRHAEIMGFTVTNANSGTGNANVSYIIGSNSTNPIDASQLRLSD
jgi:hypothetical protein